MVSPHGDWEDVENGYVREDRGVFVEPAVVLFGDGLRTYSRGVAESDANCYSVEVRTGIESESESWHPAAQFAELLTAWEFANLLTHYLSAVESASDDADAGLRRSAVAASEDGEATIAGDRSAESVFRALVDAGSVRDEMGSVLTERATVATEQ